MQTLIQLGIQIIRAMQTLSPALDGPMALFSFLGSVDFYILLMPFIFWVIDRRLGMRVYQIMITALALALLIKLLTHQPRPYWVGGIQTLAEEPSYGFPSAHAFMSISVWGYLAIRIKKSWLWVLSGILVIFIGISRMYVGVHFPHDVVLGWLLGLALLWLFLRTEPGIDRWENRTGIVRQLVAGMALSLLVVLVYQLVLAWLSGIQDPPLWNAFSAEARSPEPLIKTAALVLGTAAGWGWMRRWADFSSDGQLLWKAGRYLLGIASLLAIKAGLDALITWLTIEGTPLFLLFSYMQYGLLSFWILIAVPWFFLRLKLADPANESSPT